MITRSKLDPRNNHEVGERIQRLGKVKYVPLIDIVDLYEIEKIFPAIPTIEYPVNSAAELIEKLGGSGHLLNIAELKVDPLRMIKYMPAYYFPIASIENFIEKMAELIHANRKKVEGPKELENIKKQLPNLNFPIKNAEELHRQIGDKDYQFRGRKVNVKEMILHIPQEMFPMNSQLDFDSKIFRIMVFRPLIVKD
jgi:hypothetical protein